MLLRGGIRQDNKNQGRLLQNQEVPYGITLVQADRVTYDDDERVKVCIIDDGYAYGHPDLPMSGVTGYVDSSGELPWDIPGHSRGTGVAGEYLRKQMPT